MREGDKKVSGVHVNEVENEYGDVLRTEKDYNYRIPVEPDFVKMYGLDVATLNGIKGINREVITFMSVLMDYDNIVVLSPAERKRWALELGVSYHSINNSIAFLIKNGHIKKKCSGEYIVCPTMFSKGDWKKTMQKRQSFDAHFTIRYERTKAGYTRTFREAKVKPIGMKVDLETGKPQYKYKKGGPFEDKKHDDAEFNESFADIEEDDIAY